MNDDWSSVIFGMGVLVLGTVLIITVVLAATRLAQARADATRERRLQELTRKYQDSTEETLELGRQTTAELADVRRRLERIEQVLKTVE